jgi:hypothetical protein
MSAGLRATERRPVRVTIEGEAYHPSGDDRTLIVVRQDGGKIVFPSSAEGVTVEDIEPSRFWTDGDVILDGMTGDVFVRRGGWWTAEGRGTYSDETMTADLRNGDTVLRYQAGDL